MMLRLHLLVVCAILISTKEVISCPGSIKFDDGELIIETGSICDCIERTYSKGVTPKPEPQPTTDDLKISGRNGIVYIGDPVKFCSFAKFAPKTTPDNPQPTTSTESSSNATAKPTTSTESSSNYTAKPTTSTESSSNDTAKPTTSTESSLNDTSKPTTSTESSLNATAKPTTSTESSSNDTAKPTTSTESSLNDTAKPTTSTESSLNDTAKPTTSTESSSNATAKPTTSLESSSNATAKPTTSTKSSSNDTAKPTTSTETSSNATAKPTTSTETSSNATAQPTTSTESSFNATAKSEQKTNKSEQNEPQKSDSGKLVLFVMLGIVTGVVLTLVFRKYYPRCRTHYYEVRGENAPNVELGNTRNREINTDEDDDCAVEAKHLPKTQRDE